MDKEQIDSGEEIYYTAMHLKKILNEHKLRYDEDLLQSTIDELMDIEDGR